MLVKTYGSAVYGIDAITVTIEVNVSAGVKFYLVGLPDNVVRESEHIAEVIQYRSLDRDGWAG